MIYKINRGLHEFLINTDFITHTHFTQNGDASIYIVGKDAPIEIFESDYREIEKELIKQNHKFLNKTREL